VKQLQQQQQQHLSRDHTRNLVYDDRLRIMYEIVYFNLSFERSLYTVYYVFLHFDAIY